MPRLKDRAEKPRAQTLVAAIQNEPEARTIYPRVVIRRLRSWHEAGEGGRRLAVVWRVNGRASMYVGLGDRRGIYLMCNYGPPDWDLDLFSVGPGGLRGRRRMVEFDIDGNPHEAPVQCLVPIEAGLEAVEYFLRHDGLPLNIEWVSEMGLRRGFLKKR